MQEGQGASRVAKARLYGAKSFSSPKEFNSYYVNSETIKSFGAEE